MLMSAGIDTASENSNVLMPLADLTSRKTRPTRKTRMTRSSVGETMYSRTYSSNAKPKSTTDAELTTNVQRISALNNTDSNNNSKQGRRKPQRGPGKHSRGGPLGRKFLNFSF